MRASISLYLFSNRHTVQGLLDDSKDHVFCGGETDEADKFIAPTVLTEVRTDSKVMSEEIFGPLMPVFKYKKLDEVIEYVNGGEKPLTLYVFTRNSRTVQRLVCPYIRLY